MPSEDYSNLTYHVKHRQNFSDLLSKAHRVAQFALENKNSKMSKNSKYVKHIGLPSDISNQIMRKYSRGNIKKLSKVNIIAPSRAIKYNDGRITITPLKLSFNWNPGQDFIKIVQIEFNSEKFMITSQYKKCKILKKIPKKERKILSLDLNCGRGRHIINAADHSKNTVINLGKSGPHIRHKYQKLRSNAHQNNKPKTLKEIGRREYRKMKDLNHKMSRAIVNYARLNNLEIIMEDLSGIRKNIKTGNGRGKALNRLISSWSFYKLQSMIEYKAKLYGIPAYKVKPQYTSKHCSYCGVIGQRDGPLFKCLSKKCKKHGSKVNADVNAAYNVGLRYLGIH